MRQSAFGLALAASLACLPSARACPCSDDPGGSLFLTRSDERYALSLLFASRVARGAFDAHAIYRPLGAGQHEYSQELLLRGALRATERLEWQAELGAASYRFSTPTFFESERGLGDAVLRARYVLRKEAMPHERWPLPALTVAGFVRAPLGELAAERSGGFGSGGPQLGLGTWELGAGFSAQRSLGQTFGWFASVDGAYRLSDRTLGRRRQLGPRLDLGLGGSAILTDWLSANLAGSARLTSAVALSGRKLAGTDERMFNVALSLATRAGSGMRSALGVSFEPAFDGLSKNAVATTALMLGLGYAAAK